MRGLLVALLVGCGTARRGLPIADPVSVAGEAALGREVFRDHCHSCHPHGEAGLAFAINDKPLPRWLIRLQVRNGLGAMPAFDEAVLSDAELHAVAEYLVALRRSDS